MYYVGEIFHSMLLPAPVAKIQQAKQDFVGTMQSEKQRPDAGLVLSGLMSGDFYCAL